MAAGGSPLSKAERWETFRKHSLLLILEGNVGAGKSTLLTKAKENLDDIKRRTKDQTLELEILIEPIGDWIDEKGNKFLEVNGYNLLSKILVYTTCKYLNRLSIKTPIMLPTIFNTKLLCATSTVCVASALMQR